MQSRDGERFDERGDKSNERQATSEPHANTRARRTDCEPRALAAHSTFLADAKR